MKALLLVLLAAPAADSAPAGSAYIRGLLALERGEWNEAAQELETALSYVGTESEVLKYRDENGRHLHPYYPYYHLAVARMGQAQGEESLDIRMDRLRQARSYLTRTLHEGRAVQLKKVGEAIRDTAAAIKIRDENVVPPAILELENRVNDLIKIGEDKYEAAIAEIRKQPGLFTNEKGKYHEARILKKIADRQAESLRGYENMMKSRLNGASYGDVTLEFDLILPQFKPALVPVSVEDAPAPRFVWMQDFYALFERQLEPIKGVLTLPVDDVLACAAEFDKAGAKALELDLFSGFRAARNMAHKIRMARLREHVEKGDVSKAEYNRLGEKMLNAAEAEWTVTEKALKAKLEELGDAPAAEDVKRYVTRYMVSERDAQVNPLRQRMEKRITDYKRLLAANARAGAARGEIESVKVMADPLEIRRVVDELSLVERLDYFTELPRDAQARILFNRAVAKAMEHFLRGETPEFVSDQVRGDVSRAFSMDPKVDAPWRDRLSPRILKIFDALKPQNK